MPHRSRRLWAAAGLLVLLGGCATSHNYLDANAPRYEYVFGAPPARAADDPIRLVTFNIAHGQRIAEASQILAREPALQGADVIALQEMNGRGVEALAQALRMNAVYYPASLGPGDEGEMGNAVLSPWPIESSWKLLLPHLGRVKQRARAASAARVRIGERSVVIYSVHLGSPLGTGGGARREQAEALRDDAARLDEPVLLAGDFNSQGIGSLFVAAGYFWPTRDVGRTVGPFSFDHVFARGLEPAGSPSAGVAREAKEASDHRPVWATLRWADPVGFPTPGSAEGRTVTTIELTGHKVTREYVITREIRTRVGESFHPDILAADVQRLENLSVFADIGVDAEPDGKGVRLRFRFKEMPSWVPLPGFSYTEEDGFAAGPKLSALNLFGRDMSLTARAYFGSANQYSVSYSWPWISGNHRSFNFYGARLSRADTLNGFEETSYEFTPRVGTYLGEHGRLEGKFSLFRMKSDVDGKTLDPDNEDTLPRLGAALGWDSRDSWNNPRRGWQNELELWRTGGDGNFWSMNLDLRRWFPTTSRQRLMLNSLLSLQSGTVGEDLPVYLIYRMGGANSIRGYEIADLGRRLYGKNQLIGTAEYSFNLMPLRRFDLWKFALRLGLDVALFADGGIAWSEPGEFAWHRGRGGIGGGLRLLVPGSEMVRFDAGWSEEGGFQFHFGSGSKPVAQRLRLR